MSPTDKEHSSPRGRRTVGMRVSLNLHWSGMTPPRLWPFHLDCVQLQMQSESALSRDKMVTAQEAKKGEERGRDSLAVALQWLLSACMCAECRSPDGHDCILQLQQRRCFNLFPRCRCFSYFMHFVRLFARKKAPTCATLRLPPLVQPVGHSVQHSNVLQNIFPFFDETMIFVAIRSVVLRRAALHSVTETLGALLPSRSVHQRRARSSLRHFRVTYNYCITM